MAMNIEYTLPGAFMPEVKADTSCWPFLDQESVFVKPICSLAKGRNATSISTAPMKPASNLPTTRDSTLRQTHAVNLDFNVCQYARDSKDIWAEDLNEIGTK